LFALVAKPATSARQAELSTGDIEQSLCPYFQLLLPQSFQSYSAINMDLSLQMVRDLPGLVKHHYKEGNFNWPMIVYITIVHTVAIAGLFAIARAKVETLLWAFALWPTRYEPEANDA
jgi:hypothetical protein